MCQNWEYKGFFTLDPILKITDIKLFSRLANYVITQVHACREEKVMATGSKLQDDNDQDSDVGTPLNFSFWQPPNIQWSLIHFHIVQVLGLVEI